MKSLLKAFLRYLAEVAASEAGELLSVRRKAHLLEAQRYSRLASQPQPNPGRAPAIAVSRCAGSMRRAMKEQNAH